MSHAGEFFQIHTRINLHVAERIEVFHRHTEFFCEELRRVGHDGRAAGQEQPLRSCAALLSAIKLHGLVDLDVQTRHELPRDLGDRRLMLVLRLFVRATKTHKTLVNLDLIRHVELQLGFIRKVLSDGVRAEIDAAGENFALLEEQQIARLRADIEQHRAIFQLAVVEPERIAQRRWRHIANL